ncbi:hypothetical protein [Streptomyces sp. NPDC059460]|uniref:hypothetical protein n=1 Tax=Streptomyces sp. NPDC059460 TaxID=3346840 RepID=UPI0036AB80D3
MQGLDESGVRGVPAVIPRLDRADQQPVGGVDVAIPVDQQERGRGRRVQRLSSGGGADEPGAREQPRGVVQFASGVHADVGRLGQPAALVGRRGAEPGRTGQRLDRAERVAASQAVAGGLLRQSRDRLVRAHGRLAQVPGAVLRLSLSTSASA